VASLNLQFKLLYIMAVQELSERVSERVSQRSSSLGLATNTSGMQFDAISLTLAGLGE
jgi:phage regulator Rha-like protein